MCRYPASSAARTASRVSPAGVWKTPRPTAGSSTPLFKVRRGVAGVMVESITFVVGKIGEFRRPGQSDVRGSR